VAGSMGRFGAVRLDSGSPLRGVRNDDLLEYDAPGDEFRHNPSFRGHRRWNPESTSFLTENMDSGSPLRDVRNDGLSMAAAGIHRHA
jgi:hypothetical protein